MPAPKTPELVALEAEVTRNKAVDDSAVLLLNGIAARIEAVKQDPAAIQKLADDLRGSSDALATAVTANTPAADPDTGGGTGGTGGETGGPTASSRGSR